MGLSDATVLLRSVKFLTDFNRLPWISTCGSIGVFVIAFNLANWNNCPSDLVQLKIPARRCSDTVDSSAARKIVDKAGAKTHAYF